MKLIPLALTLLAANAAHADPAALALDRRAALQVSQTVVGSTPGDYTLLDSEGRLVRLSSFRGKPLLVSFIYTSCYHVCPASTLALHQAVKSMRDQFGSDQFNIASIGFDQPADSPDALEAFALQQRIDEKNWFFLSPRAEDVAMLARDFGFSYVATPAGFDHTLQVTILDANGRIRRHVYGDRYAAAAVGEPLRRLLLGSPLDPAAPWTSLLDRVRILCSVYDPKSGRYRADYTLPLVVAGGVTFLIAMFWFALTEWREHRRTPRSNRLDSESLKDVPR